MEYATRSGNLAKSRAQCIVVPIYAPLEMSESAKALNQASGGQINKILKRGDLKPKAGQTLLLHDVANINAQRVILVNLGPREDLDSVKYITAVRQLIGAIKSLAVKNVLICFTDVTCKDRTIDWNIERLIEHFEAGTYQYQDMKGKPDTTSQTLEQVDFYTDRVSGESVETGIRRGTSLASGMHFAKDIANTPGNVCTPTYLAEKATKLCKGNKALSVSILEEEDMQKMGMGAFLSVCQGSEQPGKLITIHYQGTDESSRPHVLIGKGITFDTGGISLKSPPAMHEMIYDMCGAASVLGTMSTIADQKLPINVIGVLAAAENMPSGKATRPGDIVKTMSGQTVEILNTDAEGRLVLCDALTYIGQFKPASVIDIATLTGAIVTALGSVATGLFSNDDDLARQISDAGEHVLDRAWRLPIWEEYQPKLASAFADMANVGGREAGSITAACYLARFAKTYRWAHLDIAGTAYQGSGPNKGYTGRPIALLSQYLYDQI
ncbi:MAG TPA: leucyl aminopeptidase [Gammaproteobacteria bacterium]|nr:leucyl aminopeptidase [Gammaproteobacteria bacterium]